MSDLMGISDWTNLEIIDADGKYVMPAFAIRIRTLFLRGPVKMNLWIELKG